jgi:hypothetical protein
MHDGAWQVLMALVLLGLLLVGFVPGVQAQGATENLWSQPVNISRSGAASSPFVVSGADGKLQAIWWDQFDGLTTAIHDEKAWSEPASAPIWVTTVAANKEVIVAPIKTMPGLAAGSGVTLAFWQGEADEKTGVRTLQYSRLAFGAKEWSSPAGFAESVLAWQAVADQDGVIYIIYLRIAHSADSPAGLYIRRSSNGGASWSAGKLLYGSIYFRLLKAEDVYMRLAVGGDSVYVVWEDPRLSRAFLTVSSDGGETWTEPQTLGESASGATPTATGATKPQIVVSGANEALLLYQSRRAATSCALFQQRTTDGGKNWSAPERALDKMGSCAVELRRTASGQILAVASPAGGLTLAAWKDGRWSESKTLRPSLKDTVTGRSLTLESPLLVFGGETPLLAGRAQDGDLWTVAAQSSALELIAAPVSPWAKPTPLAENPKFPSLPVLATDKEGRVHALWSESAGSGLPGNALWYAGFEGARRSNAAVVLRSPDGKSEQPALVAAGDYVHAIWSGGPYGEIFHSRAQIKSASRADGWSEPLALPAPGDLADAPTIAADLSGGLHVVYAVPQNEGRGLYYTASLDGGRSWSKAMQIFDAAAAKWLMVAHPTLAVDERDTLHVAWVRALPGGGLPQALWYTRSTDGGQSWAAPSMIAEGAYEWPRAVATLNGQTHLIFHEVGAKGGVWQRWSDDGGVSWKPLVQIPGLREVSAPVSVVADGTGRLCLLALGVDDIKDPAIFYTIWNIERWGERETIRLETGGATLPGIAAAIQPLAGRLDVTYRGTTVLEYISRAMTPAASLPTPISTPLPTQTPTLVPTPSPTPTARPTVNPEPASTAGQISIGGLISLPVLGIVGVLGAAALAILAVVARAIWMRRK